MKTVFLGMGSNLGDRLKYLDTAIEKLDVIAGNHLKKVSSIIENPPLAGGPEQGPFLNLVVELETELRPLELLDRIQKIETDGGRQRGVFWGPRTIDIDILFYEDEIIDSPQLKIPHPEMYNRDFVIKPLLELSPLKIDPINKKLVSENWEKHKLISVHK